MPFSLWYLAGGAKDFGIKTLSPIPAMKESLD
jgi:hypothetical protein